MSPCVRAAVPLLLLLVGCASAAPSYRPTVQRSVAGRAGRYRCPARRLELAGLLDRDASRGPGGASASGGAVAAEMPSARSPQSAVRLQPTIATGGEALAVAPASVAPPQAAPPPPPAPTTIRTAVREQPGAADTAEPECTAGLAATLHDAERVLSSGEELHCADRCRVESVACEAAQELCELTEEGDPRCRRGREVCARAREASRVCAQCPSR